MSHIRVEQIRSGHCGILLPATGNRCMVEAFLRFLFKGGGGGWVCTQHVAEFHRDLGGALEAEE